MKLIHLTKGKIAKVDDEDYEWLSKYSWHTHVIPSASMYGRTKYYAIRRQNRKRVYMHREILKDVKEVDHADGDTLNNQRSNLRECTHQQNSFNSSSYGSASNYKGVQLDNSRHKCWRAKIKLNGKEIFLGYYYTEEEAARAYDMKAKELFGDFARLNFSELQEVEE